MGIKHTLSAVRLIGRVVEQFSGSEVPPGEILAFLESVAADEPGGVVLHRVTRQGLRTIAKTQKAHALIFQVARWANGCLGPDSVYREVFPFYRALCLRMGMEPFQRDTFRKIAFRPWHWGGARKRVSSERECDVVGC